MSLPGFTAEMAVHRSTQTYRMAHTDLTVRLAIIPQQGQGMDCFQSCVSGQCSWECFPSGIPAGDGLPGPGQGGGPVETCGCRRDSTSSTGWREHCRVTVPGRGSTNYLGDECEAPGCGPCTCSP